MNCWACKQLHLESKDGDSLYSKSVTRNAQKKPKPPAMAKEDKVDEERKRKSSQARIDSNARYIKKCKRVELQFTPNEQNLYESAKKKADSQGQSFQGYVKSLIRDDMTSE